MQTSGSTLSWTRRQPARRCPISTGSQPSTVGFQRRLLFPPPVIFFAPFASTREHVVVSDMLQTGLLSSNMYRLPATSCLFSSRPFFFTVIKNVRTTVVHEVLRTIAESKTVVKHRLLSTGCACASNLSADTSWHRDRHQRTEVVTVRRGRKFASGCVACLVAWLHRFLCRVFTLFVAVSAAVLRRGAQVCG